MDNIKHIIDGYNKTVMSKANNDQTNTTKRCNYEKTDICPLSGKCLAKSIDYQATVVTNNKRNETYVGLQANTFKTRLNNHNTTFRNRHKRFSNELSKHIWELIDDNID